MCTPRQLDAITKEMAKCYRNYYGDAIVGIFLYGSYARGDFSTESDIDVTAVVKGKRLDLQKKLKYIWDYSADVGLEHNVVISPTVIPHDEFEMYKNTLPYYMNIQREGKRIG